jgi:hypothetical protein
MSEISWINSLYRTVVDKINITCIYEYDSIFKRLVMQKKAVYIPSIMFRINTDSKEYC